MFMSALFKRILCATCMPGVLGGQMRVGTGVTDGCDLLGIQPRASGRPVRAFNHRAISPARVLYFCMLKTSMETSLFTVGVNPSEGFLIPVLSAFFLLSLLVIVEVKEKGMCPWVKHRVKDYKYISLPLHDYFLPNS